MYASNTSIELVERINNALPDSNIILAKWNEEDNYFDLSQCIIKQHESSEMI